jgi:predicted outer membrane repeat protein
LEYQVPAGGLTQQTNYIVTLPQASLFVTVNGFATNNSVITNIVNTGDTVAMSSFNQTNGLGTTRWIPTNWVDGAANAYAGSSKSFSIAALTYWTNNYRVEYKCTVETNNTSAGTASVASPWVTNGDSIAYSATANGGYAFTNWSSGGTIISESNPYSPTISRTTNLTAVFVALGETVGIVSVPAGLPYRVDGVNGALPTPNNESLSIGDHTVDIMQVHTINSTTQARFNNWSDGGSQFPIPATTTNITYNVASGGGTLTATFDLYYKLTTNNPTGGTIGVGSPSGDDYYISGASKTLTASASSGYAFKQWSGDIGSATATDPEITVTMSQARSIQASFAKTLYVTATATATGAGATWADAARLTNAINSLVAGDEIWAAAGTYYPPDNTHGIQLKNSVVIYGGMTVNQGWAGRNWAVNHTIISGDFSGDGYSDMTNSPLMTMSNKTAAANATLDGLIFQYGSNNAATATMYGGALGGNSGLQNGGYTISHCVFRYNYATHGGAIYHNYGTTVIENSLFHNNRDVSEGGAIFMRRGTMTMRGCTFASNIGGVAGDFTLDGATGNATDCIFGSYTGSGTPAASVYAKSSSAMTLTKCYAVTNGVAAITLVNCSTADPKLRNPAGFDFRLKSDSPCIGTASGTTLTDDLAGSARPYPAVSGVRDVGCYEASGFYNNTVNSSPAGRDVVVDGVASVAGPANVISCEGSVVMTTASTQTVGTTRYVFQHWTDGVNADITNPTNSFTITQATNWTAVFQTQYKATVTTVPESGGGTVTLATDVPLDSENVWTASGGTISLKAVPEVGYTFTGWSGDTAGIADVGALTVTVTMSAARALTATFTAAAGYEVTVKKDDATAGEVRFLVDDQEYTNTYTFNFEADSIHTVEVVNATQDWNDDKVGYIWSSWSDSLARKHEVTITGAATFTATMQKQYMWTLTTVGGTATPATGWYNDGATFTAEATSAGFSGWSGDLSGDSSSVPVTMNAVKAATATFKSIVYVDSAKGSEGNGTSWATAYKTLHYAMAASAAGSEFWVKAGSYSPTNATTGMQLENGDLIYGGFDGMETGRGDRDWTQNVTIVTGDWTGDNASDMTTSSLMKMPATGSATVDGLIFQRGKNSDAVSMIGSVIGYPSGSSVGAIVADHCIFRDNESSTGVIVNNYSTSRIRNSLFIRNTTTGGVVYNRRGTTVLTGCTLADNTGYDVYSANDNSDPDPAIYMTNCIARSGSLAVYRAGDNGPSAIVNCNIKGLASVGLISVTGSFDENPLFTSDYRLSYGSPSVDDGLAVSDTMDLARRTRTLNGAPDLGCYEGTTLTVTVTPTTGASVTFNGVLYSAPAVVGVEAGTYYAERVVVQTVGTTKYTFSKWTLDGLDGVGSPYEVTVTSANRVLDAVFTVSYQLALTITPVGYGTVANGTDGTFYPSGTVLGLNPAAVEGVVFSAWSGDLTGSSDPQNLTMDAAKSVTATFIADGPTTIRFQ